jgi:hypothetical protein
MFIREVNTDSIIRGITHEQKKKEKNPQNLADSFKGIDACQLCKHFSVCACLEQRFIRSAIRSSGKHRLDNPDCICKHRRSVGGLE